MRPKWEMLALTLHEADPRPLPADVASPSSSASCRRSAAMRGFTAYVEGWALYSESLGEDMGLYDDDPYSRFGRLTYEMWRAVRLVVDTGMHVMHWDRERAIKYFMDNAAKTELDVTNEIDRYISWPGQALAYKVGELKIKELRERARSRLGERFDLRAFNDCVLETGPVPLQVLEAQVEAWIAAGGPALAARHHGRADPGDREIERARGQGAEELACRYFRCLLTNLVIANMLTVPLPPKIGFKVASALICRLFLGSCSLFFLM